MELLLKINLARTGLVVEKIEEKLSLDAIVAHTVYPDEIFSQIIECLILFNEYEELDFNSYMEIFGKSFVGKLKNVIPDRKLICIQKYSFF